MDIGSAHAQLGIDDRSIADELIINVYTLRVRLASLTLN